MPIFEKGHIIILVLWRAEVYYFDRDSSFCYYIFDISLKIGLRMHKNKPIDS